MTSMPHVVGFGADPHAVDGSGDTPLDIAARSERSGPLRLLTDLGVTQVWQKYGTRMTSLTIATGHRGVMEYSCTHAPCSHVAATFTSTCAGPCRLSRCNHHAPPPPPPPPSPPPRLPPPSPPLASRQTFNVQQIVTSVSRLRRSSAPM